MPKSVEQNKKFHHKSPRASLAWSVTSFQRGRGSDQLSKLSIRAAARIPRPLPELLLRVSLLLQFGNAPTPGVDEPVTDLFTSVSFLAQCPGEATHLSHRETGARAEHLLLFLGGIRMSEMFLEPLFEHVCNIPGKIAPSLLRHLRSHIFRLKLYRPAIAILILISIVSWAYVIAIRCRAVRRARGMIRRLLHWGAVVINISAPIAVAVTSYSIVRRWVAIKGVVLVVIRGWRWRQTC